jgi:hypothetical protein
VVDDLVNFSATLIQMSAEDSGRDAFGHRNAAAPKRIDIAAVALVNEMTIAP